MDLFETVISPASLTLPFTHSFSLQGKGQPAPDHILKEKGSRS